MDLKSETLTINQSAKIIFDYISDFNHFGSLLPPQITDWKCTEDSCSFNIQNMATLAMKIKEKNEPTVLIIASEAPSPFSFELKFNFEILDEKACTSYLEMFADVNPMLSMMLKKPLQNFVDMLNSKMKEVAELQRT